MAIFIMTVIMGGMLTFVGVILTSISAEVTFNVFIWAAFMYISAGVAVLVGLVELIKSIVRTVHRNHRHEEFIPSRYSASYGKVGNTRKTGKK